MNTLGLAILMQVSIAANGPETYSNAHDKTLQKGCPMVVMVGADWCHACQVMKQTVMPEVQRRGILGRVAYAIVNIDHEHELGQELTSGGPIPQLLMYRQTPLGWRLRKLIGGQSVDTVQSFIAEGVKLDKAEKLAQKQPQSAQPKEPQTASSSTAAKQTSLSVQSPKP